MNGKAIFEAMTDIDDEFIEKAQNYRPHKAIPVRRISGILAAALILFVGIRAFRSIGGQKSSATNDFAAIQSVAGGTQENVVKDGPVDEACGVKGNENAPESENGILEDARKENYFNSTSKQENSIYVGQIEGYRVFLYDVKMEGEEITNFHIHVMDENQDYRLEESPLTEEQQKKVEDMVKAYLLKEDS